jgi:hypothetical protein
MKELNNPAARLHALLQKAKQNTEFAGTLSTEVWPKLLNVPKENQPLMFKRFGGVMELPLLIKERIENLPDINHELQLRWMSKINQAFQANNFSAAFASFIGKIDDSTLLGIEHCADILSRRDPDPEIKPDELESLRQQVDDLINETKNSEIEADLKKFIFKHLFTIRNAIEEYQVFGSKPLVTAFGQIIAAAYTEPQTAIKTATSSQGNKFLKIVAGIGLLLTVGNQGLQLTEGALKLLQPPHDTVIELKVDSGSKK